MRKVVLSVNWNPDYLFFLPITVWCWRKLNWEPIVLYNDDNERSEKLLWLTFKYIKDAYKLRLHQVKDIEGYRSDTITQTSRLYGALLAEVNDMVMTSDIDMLPLGDHWNPKHEDITIYNHDLTGYGNYAICYLAMTKERWVEIMGLSSNDYNSLLKRDLDSIPTAKSGDFYDYWETDQNLITQRINSTQFKLVKHNRGQYSNGYAKGRVDRGAWTLDHKEFIDAHLFHQIYHKGREDKFEQTMDLLEKIWPEENFDWFVLYTEEFRRLTGHK